MNPTLASPSRTRLVTIALLSAAVMLYEIGITRILSVVLWYHFAFLAVSLAMLGLGVPGVWCALRGPGPRALQRALVAASVSAPLSIVIILRCGGSLPSRVAVATASIAACMLAFGTAVCVLLLEARGRSIAAMYGSDLAGAAAGALCIVPLMRVMPTPWIVAGTGALPAAALLALGRRRAGSLLLACVLALVAWRAPLRVTVTKTYHEAGLGLLYEKWTPIARLTVYPTPFWRPDASTGFAWGMGRRYVPHPVEQLWLEQDGSAGTPITRLAGPPQSLDHLLWDVTSVGYQIGAPRDVCVIGAGGGRDILTALAAGSVHVDAVELNDAIVDLVTHRFGALSGDVYHLPGVEARVGEGRSFLTSTPRRYDRIQISLIDSWAATAAGAFALSENYLYTVEAYRLYWNRLSDEGMISTSRWIYGTNKLETLRLAQLVRAALEREGVADPDQHVAIVQAEAVATVLASRRPFTGAAYDALAAVCERRGFVLHWPSAPNAPRTSLAALVALGPDALRHRGIDLTPPVDDRPFFFHDVGVFRDADAALARDMSLNDRAVIVLRVVMIVVSAAGVVLFFLPFALGRVLPRGPGFWRGSVYCALIGLAFMLTELPLIQRSILYLGDPSHATTVVLTSLLLGAGLGSLAIGRRRGRGAAGWSAILLVMLGVANLAIPRAFGATIGAPWPARVGLAAAMAAAMGCVMGPALPLGMLRFGDRSKAWFWAVNGACGVIASAASLGLAMTLGFAATMWAGVACYALAVPMLLAAPASGPSDDFKDGE